MLTTRRALGISRSTFLRLCSRAPRMTIRSLAIFSSGGRAARYCSRRREPPQGSGGRRRHRHRSCTSKSIMMRQAMQLLGLLVGVVLASSAAATADPWVLWSRDTQFKSRQPAKLWQTGRWLMRGGPFDTRGACDRLMDEHLRSAASLLGDAYRVTSVVGSSLVARQLDGQGGLRRRYMCLPASVAPPR